jgi:hypothetical protein
MGIIGSFGYLSKDQRDRIFDLAKKNENLARAVGGSADSNDNKMTTS